MPLLFQFNQVTGNCPLALTIQMAAKTGDVIFTVISITNDAKITITSNFQYNFMGPFNRLNRSFLTLNYLAKRLN